MRRRHTLTESPSADCESTPRPSPLGSTPPEQLVSSKLVTKGHGFRETGASSFLPPSASRSRPEFHTHSISLSPNDDAMLNGIVKKQIKFRRQHGGVRQPYRGSRGREISDGAIDHGSSLTQDDLAGL
jgi:hypothetical protein